MKTCKTCVFSYIELSIEQKHVVLDKNLVSVSSFGLKPAFEASDSSNWDCMLTIINWIDVDTHAFVKLHLEEPPLYNPSDRQTTDQKCWTLFSGIRKFAEYQTNTLSSNTEDRSNKAQKEASFHDESCAKSGNSKKITAYVKRGCLCPSRSPWGTNVLMVAKPHSNK